MKLRPDETDLLCEWVFADGKTVGNEICERIATLTTQHLEQVAVDETGWDKLYCDPEDGRYWELTYPQSEMHGGGPTRLIYISPRQARSKYGDSIAK